MKTIRKHSETILQALFTVVVGAIIITWFANIKDESIEDLKSRENWHKAYCESKAKGIVK